MVKILIAQKEQEQKKLEEMLSQIDPVWKIFPVKNRKQVLETAEREKPEVVFLDTYFEKEEGLFLTEKIKKLLPKSNLIVCAEDGTYALEAFQLYVSGFLQKPLTKERVEEAMKNLRYPIPDKQEKKLQIQCFGSFQVSMDGKPLTFIRAKSKEILAYLVDLRGSSATTGELCGILWEDSMEAEKAKHYVRNLLADLRNTLRACGAEEVLIAGRNQYAINTSLVDCDYYRYLDGDPEAKKAYEKADGYMEPYKWAELEV